MNNITYRIATAADIPDMIDSRIEALSVLQAPPLPGEEEPLRISLKKYLEHAIPAHIYICCLAKDGDIIVGVGGITVRQHPGNFKNPEGRVGYVMNMYTRPEYRNNGIATNVLNKLIETGREIGLHTFELHASKMGEPVYVKNGFKIHHEPTYRKVYER